MARFYMHNVKMNTVLSLSLMPYQKTLQVIIEQ